jgi:hypothetical protein
MSGKSKIINQEPMMSPPRSKNKPDIAIITPPPVNKSKSESSSPVPSFRIRDDIDKVDEKENNEKDLLSSTNIVTPIKGKKSKPRSKSLNILRLSTSEKTSQIQISSRVIMIYKLIRKATGALGGNGYDGPIYGELTMHSMQKVINILVEKCELTYSSRFIDIGAGLGKPNFHVAQDPVVRLSIGIEIEELRWKVRLFRYF